MTTSSSPQGKQLLETVFQGFVENGVFPIERCFAPEYEQWSDGTVLDYDAFVQHSQALLKRKEQGYSVDSFTLHETVSEGNKIVSRHSLACQTPDGQPFTVNVLALFEIKDNRFVRCWELSHTDSVSESDQSLASLR